MEIDAWEHISAPLARALEKITKARETEVLLRRAANAIERMQRRTGGQATPYALARVALIAMGDVSRETLVQMAENVEKTTPKLRHYRKASQKGARTIKRVKAARQAEQEGRETGDKAA